MERSPDQRAGVSPVPADQAVEKEEPKAGVFPVEGLGGLDDVADALSFLVDATVGEDGERCQKARVGMTRNPGQRRRLVLIRTGRDHSANSSLRSPPRHRPEHVRVDPAGRPVAGDAVLALDPAANALRASQEVVVPVGHRLFQLVAFKNKIEELRPGPEAVELRQDGELAADPDVEFRAAQGVERYRPAAELEPIGLLPRRREQRIIMPPPDERVPQFDIAADAAVDLDVRQEGGDLHQVTERNTPAAGRQEKGPVTARSCPSSAPRRRRLCPPRGEGSVARGAGRPATRLEGPGRFDFRGR